jgi:hypothetical protein
VKDKKTCQDLHARRRAKERFGLVFESKDQQKITKKIQAGEAYFIKQQSDRISIYDVKYNGSLIRIVYDSGTQQIVTVMYPHVTPLKVQNKVEIEY